MSDSGVDGGAVVNALAMRSAALFADLAVKDVQLEQAHARIAELEAAAKAPAK